MQNNYTVRVGCPRSAFISVFLINVLHKIEDRTQIAEKAIQKLNKN